MHEPFSTEDPEFLTRASIAITVAEMAIMKRDGHPLFDPEAYKRAVELYERAKIRSLTNLPAG